MRDVEFALRPQPHDRRAHRLRQPPRVNGLAPRHRPQAVERTGRGRPGQLVQLDARRRCALLPRPAIREHTHVVAPGELLGQRTQLQPHAVERRQGRLGCADQDPHRAILAACARQTVARHEQPRAIVVCPVLPYPPVTGGQKRTLRLLETMERAGARPHVLSADDRSPEAAEALRARGWGVDVVPEPATTARARLAQHVAGRPSPYLHGVAARLERLQAQGAVLVQLEHTQSAYYRGAPGIPTVLSLHNLDSRLLAQGARALRPGSVAWLRTWNRARAMRRVERAALPRADRVVCVSSADARAVAHAGGHVLLAPNGVDDAFFAVPAAPGAEQAVFFGHFGYEPNRRGIERFVAEGWPDVLRRRPQAQAGGGRRRHGAGAAAAFGGGTGRAGPWAGGRPQRPARRPLAR